MKILHQDDIIIVDDFLENPDVVRANALAQVFDFGGSFPGTRTKSQEGSEFFERKDQFEKLLGKEIKQWPNDKWASRWGKANTAYQLIPKDTPTWIHADRTDYAGVLHLTPTYDTNQGTSFWEHKVTGQRMRVVVGERIYESEWQIWKYIEAKYNRLILYPASYYHSGGGDKKAPGQGVDKLEQRLTQVFFFNVNVNDLIESIDVGETVAFEGYNDLMKQLSEYIPEDALGMLSSVLNKIESNK
jgi:hypothetical protein